MLSEAVSHDLALSVSMPHTFPRQSERYAGTVSFDRLSFIKQGPASPWTRLNAPAASPACPMQSLLSLVLQISDVVSRQFEITLVSLALSPGILPRGWSPMRRCRGP